MTAGLVECNNQIIAFDMRADRIENLIKGRSPIFEPDLDERLQLAIAEKKLCFTIKSLHIPDFCNIDTYCIISVRSQLSSSSNLVSTVIQINSTSFRSYIL